MFGAGQVVYFVSLLHAPFLFPKAGLIYGHILPPFSVGSLVVDFQHSRIT